MNNVQDENVIKWIVSNLIHVIKTDAQLKEFYSLLPVRLLPDCELLTSPHKPSLKGAEERIDREVKCTAGDFRTLIARLWDLEPDAAWNFLSAPAGYGCRSRMVVKMRNACSRVPDELLPGKSAFWHGYMAGADAQRMVDRAFT